MENKEKTNSLQNLVEGLAARFEDRDAAADHLWYAVKGALDPRLLVSNLAEALRISAGETEKILAEGGFGEMAARARLAAGDSGQQSPPSAQYRILKAPDLENPFTDLFSVEFFPPLHEPVAVSPGLKEAVGLAAKSVAESMPGDPFGRLYREDVLGYRRSFMEKDAPEIDRYIEENFYGDGPKYVVNSGIGANEQFNHFVAALHNRKPDRKRRWLVIDSPRRLCLLPSDARVENTLFMEFSRSGKTEETLKIHEYTPREAKRIVFANSGPLREIGLRDGNLVLELPDRVSGRFGRNKTPILLAPMHVAGMDTKRVWEKIAEAVERFDLSDPGSLPMATAMFLFLHQRRNGINHIYLGCNDDILAASADELIQFWNEGVNKNGNDISMSRYFGLPRDSHLNIEAILANRRTKMGIFLLKADMKPETLPPMVSEEIDPMDPAHARLTFGDEERILAEANCRRFAELMPTVRIEAKGKLQVEHEAVLGQLWADATFCYSRLAGVDPGSNPEVKAVRDRAAKLLAQGGAG